MLIADEMISPFSTEDERTRNLIDHHMAYIDEALANIATEELPEVEQWRRLAFSKVDRYAHGGLHDLLEEVRRERIAHAGYDSAWQRVRFAVLELEALVAGIDYDVERKTYAKNFMNMAWDEGFKVLEHQRVYRTVGESALDAGTHVYAMWRPR